MLRSSQGKAASRRECQEQSPSAIFRAGCLPPVDGPDRRSVPHHEPLGREFLKNSFRKAQRGFTLIELMVVMAIISVLLAIAVPIYQKSITHAKESVLRNNLFTIRNMIDEYTIDKQKAPESLQDLVSDGYLRQIPQDPMTNSDQTWKLVMEDTAVGGTSSSPGIFDVHSGSDKVSLDGTNYADW